MSETRSHNDEVTIHLGGVTSVTARRTTMRGVVEHDTYPLRVTGESSRGHAVYLRLELRTDPGADIGLGLLVHGDGETYNTGYADGVASKGDETGYCGEASKGDA